MEAYGAFCWRHITRIAENEALMEKPSEMFILLVWCRNTGRSTIVPSAVPKKDRTDNIAIFGLIPKEKEICNKGKTLFYTWAKEYMKFAGLIPKMHVETRLQRSQRDKLKEFNYITRKFPAPPSGETSHFPTILEDKNQVEDRFHMKAVLSESF